MRYVLAALAGCLLIAIAGAQAPDSGRLGAPNVPFAPCDEEAVTAIRQWAWWDLGGVKTPEMTGYPWPFGARLRVVSEDGADVFEYDPYRHAVRRWSTTRDITPAELGGLDAPAARSELVLSFAALHYRGCRADQLRVDPLGCAWQVLPGGVVFEGNRVVLTSRGRNGPITGVALSASTVRVPVEPRVDRKQVGDTVARWLVVDPAAGARRVLRCRPVDPAFSDACFLCVAEDLAGLQRLCYTVEFVLGFAPDITLEMWEAMQEEDADKAIAGMLQADANTGVPIPYGADYSELLFADVPSTLICGRPFEPLFPPIVRDKVVYLYVGYLESLLWPGKIAMERGRCDIQYQATRATATRGNLKAVVNGKTQMLPAPPRDIDGYFYLPTDMVEAVTGWSVEYIGESNTVSIHP